MKTADRPIDSAKGINESRLKHYNNTSRRIQIAKIGLDA